MSRSLASAIIVSLALAGCADRAVVDATDTEELPGEEQRPTGGTLYADCNEGGDCDSGLCFFPQGESGYCTNACTADAMCQQYPGTETLGYCVGVASSDDSVCAIACQGNACPFGMRCESVGVDGGNDKICF